MKLQITACLALLVLALPAAAADITPIDKGGGVAVDDAQALKHVLAAARACVPQAQAEMADRHFAGRGVARDDMTGLAWLVLAGEGEGGDQEARKAASGIVRGLEDDALQALKSIERKLRAELKCSTLAR